MARFGRFVIVTAPIIEEPVAEGSFLLVETGDYLLLEDGFYLQLEQ